MEARQVWSYGGKGDEPSTRNTSVTRTGFLERETSSSPMAASTRMRTVIPSQAPARYDGLVWSR